MDTQENEMKKVTDSSGNRRRRWRFVRFAEVSVVLAVSSAVVHGVLSVNGLPVA